MFQGLGSFGGGGGGGGAMGGGKASTGFGQWYSDMQEAKEVELTELEAGAAVESRDGTGMWRFWQANEKKTDGGPTPTTSLLPVFPFSRQEAAASEADTVVMGMSYQQRFTFFVLALLVSVLFFALAFLIGLPTLMFAPSKFAMSFTLGSLFFMGSFAMLKGPTKHLKSMLALERLPFSLAYVGSMAGTIYACAIKSYFLVVFSSAIQLLALTWYFLSFVPGGSRGMGYFMGAITKTIRYTLRPCLDACSRTLCFCLRGGGS